MNASFSTQIVEKIVNTESLKTKRVELMTRTEDKNYSCDDDHVVRATHDFDVENLLIVNRDLMICKKNGMKKVCLI